MVLKHFLLFLPESHIYHKKKHERKKHARKEGYISDANAVYYCNKTAEAEGKCAQSENNQKCFAFDDTDKKSKNIGKNIKSR